VLGDAWVSEAASEWRDTERSDLSSLWCHQSNTINSITIGPHRSHVAGWIDWIDRGSSGLSEWGVPQCCKPTSIRYCLLPRCPCHLRVPSSPCLVPLPKAQIVTRRPSCWIAMLESSSRSAPSNRAMLMASSTILLAWCSTIIEVSCSSSITTTIECKHSRVMAMAMMTSRSCPSSASKATNQASFSRLSALLSITIMIASSWLIPATIEYKHGHWATNRSCRVSASKDQEISSSRILEALR